MKKLLKVVLSIILVVTFALSSVFTSVAFTSTPVKSIKLDKSKMTMAVGQTFTLKATITPSNATDKKLLFSSNNNKIATVDKNGKITAVKVGNAIITVVSSSNKKILAKCNVTISKVAQPGDTFPLKSPVEISFTGPQWWWKSGDTLTLKDAAKMTNIKMKWNEIAYPEKKLVALSTGNITDLIQVDLVDGFKYGPVGAFVDLSKYLDKMPNLKKWMGKYEQYKYLFTSEDGKIYVAPKFSDRNDNALVWSYNKDKFDELKITALPKTLDDLYKTAKTIKQKMPSSYPIAGWNEKNKAYSVLLAVMNSSDIGDIDINFFKNENMYIYSPLHEKFKESVLFVKRLFVEGLISPEYLTMDRSKWMSAFEATEDREKAPLVSFISPGTTQRANYLGIWNDWYRTGYRKTYWPNGGPLYIGNNISMPEVVPIMLDGIAINSKLQGDKNKFNIALKYVDWLYSDEAIMGYNYGREGYHYVNEGGKPKIKPQFIMGTPEFNDAYNVKWPVIRDKVNGDIGKLTEKELLLTWNNSCAYFGTTSTFQVQIYDAELQRTNSPTAAKSQASLAQLTEKADVLGKRPLPFTSEQNTKVNDLKLACQDFVLANVDKFITGERSMDEWDAFINELKSKGALELQELYNSVYTYKVKRK